jgi:hypothetical protein
MVRAATAAGLIALAVLWAIGPGLITDAYQQRPGALLGGVISGQGRFPLDGYLLFFRRTVIALAASTTVIGFGMPWLLGWTTRTGGAVRRGVAWALLAVMVLGIVGLRLRTFDEAQDRDLMAYMTVADGIVNGRTLYQGVWDHKPPAIHITYASAAYLFGPSELALWVMGVVSALVTLAACYRAGTLRAGTLGGLIAAALWTLASGDLLLQANQPNAEVFMNASLAWAFVLLLPGVTTPGPGRWVAIGGLFLWASLYKPVVVAIAGLLMMAHAVNTLLDTPALPWPRRLWQAAQPALIVGVTAAAGWAAVFGYFAAVGRFAEFQEAVFAYNRDYAGSLVQNLLASLVPTGSVIWTAAAYFPLLLVTGAGLLFFARRAAGADSRLLLAYLAGAWLAIAMPGRLYPHYYQLLLPPLAIGIGWLTVRALRTPARPALLVVGAAIALALTTRVYQSRVSAAETPFLKFGGYGADLLETQRMGPWIERRLAPGGVLYHWGAEPGVYFFAHRSSPVSFVYNMPLTDRTERSRRYTAQVLAQLEGRPPDLVVAVRKELATLDHPVEQWIDQRYRVIPGPDGVDRFVFLVRKDAPPAAP